MSNQENLETMNNFVKELHELVKKYQLSVHIPQIQIPTQIEPLITGLSIDDLHYMYMTSEGMVSSDTIRHIWKSE